MTPLLHAKDQKNHSRSPEAFQRYIIRLYLKKTHFLPILVLFGPFWAILGPKMKNLTNLYKGCIHLAISFPMVYDTTLFGENQFLTIFGPFLVHFWPFWAQKWKCWTFFYKICNHLPISFPTIYDTTISKENPFLPIFGPFWPFWAILGPKMKNLNFFLQNLYSPPHKLSNHIWHDYIWRKPIFDHFWPGHNYAIH